MLPGHLTGCYYSRVFWSWKEIAETLIEEIGKMKSFSDKVYDLLRKVPKGRVTTYKEIAHALGTKAYRGVGQAMKRNPYAPEVP